jgi:hypothetical protein
VPLVSFEGDWSDEEAILIVNAAEVAEANFCRPNPDGLESPWIAVSHDVDGEKFYAASRYQQSGVLRAKNPRSC